MASHLKGTLVRSILVVAGVVGMSMGAVSCGNGDSSDGIASPQEALRILEASLPAGDGPRTCSLLYGGVQDSFARRLGKDNCIDAVAAASVQLDRGSIEALANLGEAHIEVMDGTATATGEGPRELAKILGIASITLEQFEDGWAVGESPKTSRDQPEGS